MALTTDFWKALARNVFGYANAATSMPSLAVLMNTVVTANINVPSGVRFLTTVTSGGGAKYLYTTNGFTFNVSQNVVTTAANGAITLTATYTITNNGSSAFTIQGIYIDANIRNDPANVDAMGWTTLDWTPLQSNLTINSNGGVGQIVYTIRMDYTTNASTMAAAVSQEATE